MDEDLRDLGPMARVGELRQTQLRGTQSSTLNAQDQDEHAACRNVVRERPPPFAIVRVLRAARDGRPCKRGEPVWLVLLEIGPRTPLFPAVGASARSVLLGAQSRTFISLFFACS